jgi:hypothetical protein
VANGLDSASNGLGSTRSQVQKETRWQTKAQSEFTARSAAQERSFHELQQVRAFLKMLGVGAEFIKDALRQLTAGRSASVPNVSLSEKAVKSAGFGNLVNLARSNG